MDPTTTKPTDAKPTDTAAAGAAAGNQGQPTLEQGAAKNTKARASEGQTDAFAEKVKDLPPVKALPESTITAAEFMEPRFVIDLPKDTPYAHLLDPKFYAHVANRIQPGAILILRDAENTYRAEFIVRNVGQGWAKVEELAKHEFKVSSAGPARDAEHRIEFVNPRTMWRVVRLSDLQELKAGFRDWDAANAWLIGHKRVMAAA